MKVTSFSIEINRTAVFSIIDCYEESPIYEEVVEEYEEMLAETLEKIKPVSLLEFGTIEQYDVTEYGKGITEALYSINSIGREISGWISTLFSEGNYLKGMLADAIADDFLFQMDHQLSDIIIGLCKENKYGIIRRLEAPQDIPMEAQKTAWEITAAELEIGLLIKDSYMYDPIKSTCQIYLLDPTSKQYNIKHDCSKCSNINCKVRTLQSFEIVVSPPQKQSADGVVSPPQKQSEVRIMGKERQSLMDIFKENNIYLSAVCAGRGTCGKCAIQVLEGEIKPSAEDEIFFTTEELEQGYRLACKAYPNENCRIALAKQEEQGFSIVTDFEEVQQLGDKFKVGKYGIAVDIGTTTIAMQLVELQSKEVIDIFTTINKQRAYGADVISRIEAANIGNRQALQHCICSDLQHGIEALVKKHKIVIQKMVIAANTTMVHLLMGYSCENLGVSPFTPVNIGTIDTTYRELFQNDTFSFTITILPGISTYVGGDIVAGLYACGFDQKDGVSVLIDLGTNGEMAIGCKERILVTSAAAGPAFEGGNITAGIGSVPGAICSVAMKDRVVHVKTIGDQEPVGICGTGVIDITCELAKEELIDETGRLEEPYFEQGVVLAKDQSGKEITFYQQDIREIQLAKAAVRAGLEALIMNYGITYEDIEQVYIAGGFGYKLDCEKAVGIGMLPDACRGKFETIGNSSLKGAYFYLVEENAKQRIGEIVSCAKEINLSSDKKFNEFYMEYMYFE